LSDLDLGWWNRVRFNCGSTDFRSDPHIEEGRILNQPLIQMKLIKLFPVSVVTLLFACEKYKEYDNLETIETSYTGAVAVSGSTGAVDGEYTGSGD